jgi:putative transposase
LRPERVHNFGTYFVTTQTFGRRKLFQVDQLAELLVKTLFHYRDEQKYLLHEFVIMPDHLHLILTPNDITLERAVQFIKGGYSHAVGQTGRKREIWQKGFTDHRIRDAGDYQKHREYIHQNPVHARLCLQPQQYTYSSARSGWQLDEVPQRLKPLAFGADLRRG